MEQRDGGDAEEGSHAWLNLIQAYMVVSARIEADLDRACGLSLAEHQVLIRLVDSPDGRLRMLDLSELSLLSKSGVTRVVDRLEKRHLVTRETCEEDRRVVYARLSLEGSRAVADSGSTMAAAIDRFFSRHLSDADIGSLRGALRRLLEGNGAWAEHRCSPSHSKEAMPPGYDPSSG
ncbi:MAG: MarR family transcriptional regulator [Actinomycetota bacterium]|nr:MarR family transcriptional regulator [Actinomycetota bacterium]